jgi:hypothetical protein
MVMTQNIIVFILLSVTIAYVIYSFVKKGVMDKNDAVLNAKCSNGHF